MNLPDYLRLRDQLVSLGYCDAIIGSACAARYRCRYFWREFAWVVLNSGTFEAANSAPRPSVVHADRS